MKTSINSFVEKYLCASVFICGFALSFGIDLICVHLRSSRFHALHRFMAAAPASTALTMFW
jgi:hypothetical protein